MFDEAVLQRVRKETPGCQKNIHFNNAGAALMPAPVTRAIQEHVDLETQIGGYEAHAATLDQVDSTYQYAAQFLHTKPQNIALVSNATDAFARALSSVPFEKGDVILTSEDDYISNQLMYMSLCKRLGLKLERVPARPEGGIDTDKAKDLISRLKPRIMALTHVPTNSGLIQDVQKIGDICRDSGTMYLVDGCQSVGQLPIDLEKLHCDFFSATMRKFLRGPRGAGFLYVSDNVLNAGLEPLFIDMQGAEWLEENSYMPIETARRYEDWEFAYALVHGSREAFKYALEIGMEQISKRTLELGQLLRNQLRELEGIEVLDRGLELAAIVTCKVPADNYDQLKTHFRAHHINVGISLWHFATIDFRRKGVDWALRLAPHYYNTEEEVNMVVQALDSFVSDYR